jgi:hypothetical protein
VDSPGVAGVTADSSGRYRLGGLTEGRISVAAHSPLFGRVTRELDLTSHGQRLDLQFDAGEEVQGVVVDEAGVGVANARVELRSAEAAGQRLTTVSGNDGSFFFSAVVRGRHSVSAHKTGFGSARPVPIEIGHVALTDLRLILPAGGTIRGTISGLDPRELAVATVVARGAGRAPLAGFIGPDGWYEIDGAAPGAWRVVASAGEGRIAQDTVLLEEAAEVAWLDLEFHAGQPLSLRVVLNGTPASGAWISIQSGADGVSVVSGRADTDGRLEVRGLAAGPHIAEILSPDRVLRYWMLVDVARQREVAIRLATVDLTIAVREAATGAPVPFAVVHVAPYVGGDGQIHVEPRSLRCDAQGQVPSLVLLEGRYRFTAEAAGQESRSVEAEVSGAERLIVLAVRPASA